MTNVRIILKTYQNSIISGAILLFCCIGLFAGVIPSVQKVWDIYSRIQELSHESEMLSTKLSNLNMQDEPSLRQQLAALISAVPTDKSLPTVFSTVEGVAAQAGVSIVSMSLSGDTALASGSAKKQTAQEKQIGARTIPFSVTIEGPLSSIQQFITLAPKVRRLLRIRTFAISFPENDRPINIALQMDAFYESSPTNLGKAGSLLPTLTDAEESIINTVSQLPLANTAEIELPPPLIGPAKTNPFAL